MRCQRCIHKTTMPPKRMQTYRKNGKSPSSCVCRCLPSDSSNGRTSTALDGGPINLSSNTSSGTEAQH